MDYRNIILILSLPIIFSCSNKREGKHLFILSGQSNMVRLDIDESFKPLLEDAFGEENILVVKDAKGSQPIWQWYKDWESPIESKPEERGIRGRFISDDNSNRQQYSRGHPLGQTGFVNSQCL